MAGTRKPAFKIFPALIFFPMWRLVKIQRQNLSAIADRAASGSLHRNAARALRSHPIRRRPKRIASTHPVEDLAKWMRTFIKDVPIQFVPAEEPFWTQAVPPQHRILFEAAL
jgi:hypothetical protein